MSEYSVPSIRIQGLDDLCQRNTIPQCLLKLDNRGNVLVDDVFNPFLGFSDVT